MIEIYDINNGKLKYSAYTFWQLCEMVTVDFAYHTGDEENDIVGWIEEKARPVCKRARKKEALKRLGELLEFGEKHGHRAFASRVSLLLGVIAFEEGRHESAIGYSQKAVSLLPDHLEALYQLARGFAAVGQYQKAAQAWRKANGIFPSEEAFLCLAETLEKLKRPKEQQNALMSLLRSYPHSIKGLHALLQLYRRQGKSQPAARLAQRIVDLRPDKGERFRPFFDEFADALIWTKYNYDARKLNEVLEFFDEEQERNPEERLGLLKAVMLYRLDKRLCREECCYELGKYFEAIAFEKNIMADDLRQVVEVFGQEFSRGVVRFINNQLTKRLLRRKARESSSSARTSPELADSPQATSWGETQ